MYIESSKENVFGRRGKERGELNSFCEG